jgi:hypothetical protein
MLTTRLRWFLDKQGKLYPVQSRFCIGNTAIDDLVQLETKVLTGMANNKYTGTVFIDISKAFDLVWHDELIQAWPHVPHHWKCPPFHHILPQTQENTGHYQSGDIGSTFLGQWYTTGFRHQSNSFQYHDQ